MSEPRSRRRLRLQLGITALLLAAYSAVGVLLLLMPGAGTTVRGLGVSLIGVGVFLAIIVAIRRRGK